MQYDTPWASFCMSTYKRPDFLKTQVGILLKQTFSNFEIVISDNDTEAAGEAVATSFNDPRVKYECNGQDLGMVKSFNKSIERARGKFIVMVTDDDPVFENMLDFFYALQNQYPGYSLYCGASRKHAPPGDIEIIKAGDFLPQFLDPGLTLGLHWSSCLLKKETLVQTGMLADYGSGHLVDHLMITLMGSKDGAVIINSQFSSVQLHQSNYSKVNFGNYYKSCKGFYEAMQLYLQNKPDTSDMKVVLKHLHLWFISCFFSLRRFYTIYGESSAKETVAELDTAAGRIMQLPYMKVCRFRYAAKKIIFFIKKRVGLLKP